jgi:hypothetical protein
MDSGLEQERECKFELMNGPIASVIAICVVSREPDSSNHPTPHANLSSSHFILSRAVIPISFI